VCSNLSFMKSKSIKEKSAWIFCCLFVIQNISYPIRSFNLLQIPTTIIVPPCFNLFWQSYLKSLWKFKLPKFWHKEGNLSAQWMFECLLKCPQNHRAILNKKITTQKSFCTVKTIQSKGKLFTPITSSHVNPLLTILYQFLTSPNKIM